MAPAPKTVFYCRVSSREQRPDSQVAAARKLGVKDKYIFIEKASGARHDRPELDKALAALEPGDTLACFKLDRLGRSLSHLTKLLDGLEVHGIHFMTTEDGLNTKGSTGKLVLHVLGAIAQFERSLILERTRAGLAAAKDRGATFGRRRKLAPADIAKAQDLLAAGELKTPDVAAMFKVSPRTLFRELRSAREREELHAKT